MTSGADRLIRHLPEVFDTRPGSDTYKLLSAIAKAIDAADVEVQDALDDRFVVSADGAGLNRLGEGYAIPRPPHLTDSQYAILIQTKMPAKRGTLHAIKSVFEAVSGMTVVSIEDRQVNGVIPSWQIWLTVEDFTFGRGAWVGLTTNKDGYPIESGLVGPVYADNTQPYYQGLHNDYYWSPVDVFSRRAVDCVRLAGTVVLYKPLLPQLHDLTHNPIALWQGTNTKADSSGNGYDLALTAGTEAYGDGLVPGGAFSFNAATTYGITEAALRLQGDMTLAMLAKHDATPSHNAWMVACYAVGETPPTNLQYSLSLETSFVNYWHHEYSTGQDSIHHFSHTNPSAKWIHLAAVREGPLIKLYRDGILRETSPSLTAASDGGGTAVRVGGSEHFSLFYKGLMQSIKLAPSALTADQVKAEASRCLGRIIP